MIRIEAPDGSIIEFPEGTADETIKSVMARSYPATSAEQSPAAPRAGALQTMKDATQGVVRGATMGFADEIMAAGMTPFGMAKRAITGEDSGKSFTQRAADSYNDALAFNRKTQNEAAERSPVANVAGQITGGVLTAGNLAKGGVTLMNAARPTAASLAARGAAEGAIYGGVTGLGEGEGAQDRVARALYGAGIGGMTGGMTGAVSGKIAKNAAQKAIPSAEALKARSQAAYRAAEDAGIVLNPKGYGQVVDDMYSTIATKGYDHQMTPDIHRAITRLQELKGQPVTLQTVNQMRELIGTAAQSQKPREQMLASIMRDKLDDYVAKLSQADVLLAMPNASIDDATASLGEARKLWAQNRKSEALTGAVDSAELRSASTYAGGNQDNAIRQNVRRILESGQKFTPEERQALETIVRGTPTQNALRLLGKLAPQGNGLGLFGNLTAGYSTSGATLPLTAAAAGAKFAADRMTKGNVAVADALIRSGGVMPTAKPLSPQTQMLIDAILSAQGHVAQRLYQSAPIAPSR